MTAKMFKSHQNFYTEQFEWGRREVFSQEKGLVLCLPSLISETGGKFAAHIKNGERKCIAEDKWSSFSALVMLPQCEICFIVLLLSSLWILFLKGTSTWTKGKENQSGSSKVRTFESQKASIVFPKIKTLQCYMGFVNVSL